ncbi:hypothetical protein GOBAR_AA00089 [Gossypium barbadense]|uniref:Uncharacterized protein n=1 Tax=Gossypium barbadense TaxID=3634 RepID=A0A2P5YY29_GOSBA|nr:hypothetical protein GOBAR_AA00089 [Gossypium barbadense]
MNWTRVWWWLGRSVLVLWGDIIKNVLVGLLLGRLGETILGRVGSSVPLDHPYAKHARDALWRHLADEAKMVCRYLRDGGKTDALEWLGLLEAALGAKVCQHFEGEKCMWRLRACSSFSSLNSSICKPSIAPNSGTLSWWINLPRIAPKGRWLGGLESNQPTEPVLQQLSRCSDSQLKVGPEVFGTVLSGAFRGTVGEGDEFSRLDPRKRTLPSSSLKWVRWFSFLVKATSKACNIKNNNNSAELGMTHLHRTEWKNTEYRKRDFLIWCGSDNVGICDI